MSQPHENGSQRSHDGNGIKERLPVPFADEGLLRIWSRSSRSTIETSIGPEIELEAKIKLAKGLRARRASCATVGRERALLAGRKDWVLQRETVVGLGL